MISYPCLQWASCGDSRPLIWNYAALSCWGVIVKPRRGDIIPYPWLRHGAPWRGNLLSAQGRMERSGMAPWVTKWIIEKRPTGAKAGLHVGVNINNLTDSLAFAPVGRRFFCVCGLITQGAASLCPGLMAGCPFRALVASGRETPRKIFAKMIPAGKRLAKFLQR